jgi:signal transduction histidine kinase
VIFQHAPKAAGEIQICFSQDSARLGFHDIDRAGDLVIVDLPSRSMSSQSFSLRGAPFALLPEANQFALAAENEIKIVQLDTGELLQRIHAPEAVTSLLASPDGRKLAATCHGTDVYLWNLEARELYVLRSHTERNTTLEFSPASDVLMSSSLDNVTCLWDCATGRELLRATECNGLDFSRDGQHLGCLVERRELAIYQLTGGAALRTLAGPGPRDQQLNRFDLSPDGNLFAAILNGGLEIWTLDSAQAASFFPMADARALTFFPDGNSLLLARAGVGLERVMVEITPVTGTPDTTVRLGVHEKIGLPDSVSIQQVALSSDARTVCLDLDDRRMLVADLRGEREPVFLSERARYNFRLAPAGATGSGRFGVSPDGRYVAVGYGLRKHPLVFNARTGEVVTELPVAPGTVVFDHNGQHLLTSGANEYSLWRVADWQRVWKRTFESLGTQWGCMSFSGDDRWVALNLDRHRLALLDAARGETLSVLTPPDPQTIGGIRLAHDSGRLVAPTFNNLVQVWNLTALRRELAPLGFDCTTPFRAQAPVAFAPGGTLPGSAAAITFGVTAAICLGVLTVAVLRRHRRLAEEFVETEARAFRHERELQVQRELNRLKSNFVSMVSHEFRTPLGVIQSSAEILQAYFDRLKTEKRTEHLAEIVQSTTRMKDLMEEVLLLSRVDSGRMECKPALLDLRSLAQRVCAELESSTERRCPIHFEEHALDDAPARVDERLLTIVLSNLLSNAVKYSPAGLPVQLSIRRAPQEVIFEISDHGMGIPEVDQQYLFSTFHRGSNVGHILGTGLGLTIVKRCAELHGATVSFTSTEGRGTTFVLRLPV